MANNLQQHILGSAMAPALGWQGGLKQCFCFAHDFIGFQGHFPAKPLLPAIVQLQLGFLLAAKLENRPLIPATISRAKFMNPIKPGDRLEVCCIPSGGNRYTVSITLNNDIKAAIFTLTMQEDYAD